MTDTTTEATAETTSSVAVAEPAPAEVIAASSDIFDNGSTPAALQRIAAEAVMLDQIYAYADRLSKTPLVPEIYQQANIPRNSREPRGKQAAADLAVAIMYGAELGLTALQSAQNVFPVNGKPGVYSKTMVAQVRAWIDKNGTGVGPEGDDVWEVSASADKVVWAGRRNGKTAASEWTIARAEQAGFTKNPKYQQQPQEMLRAKAQAEICRILFQDVLLGMAHSVEELQLSDNVSVQVVRPATKQRGVGGLQQILAQRKAAAAAPVEAEVVEAEPEPQRHPAEPGPADQSVEQAPLPEPTPVPEPGRGAIVVDPECLVEPEPELISKRQVTEVKRLLAKETFTNPKAPETLAYVAQMVALEELPSLEALTAAQADAVIAELSK